MLKKEVVWARERNFTKMRLLGVVATLHNIGDLPSTLKPERAWIYQALVSLEAILSDWDKNLAASKKQFLSGR